MYVSPSFTISIGENLTRKNIIMENMMGRHKLRTKDSSFPTSHSHDTYVCTFIVGIGFDRVHYTFICSSSTHSFHKLSISFHYVYLIALKSLKYFLNLINVIKCIKSIILRFEFE